MTYPIIACALGFCLVTGASAQTSNAVLQNSQSFMYATSGSGNLAKRDRFCLPRDQKLLRVTGVVAGESNDKSTINVSPDIEANCVDVDVLLPPAKIVCMQVPNFHGLTVKFYDSCQSVPTTVGFSVKYEAEKLPETGNVPPVGSNTTGAK